MSPCTKQAKSPCRLPSCNPIQAQPPLARSHALRRRAPAVRGRAAAAAGAPRRRRRRRAGSRRDRGGPHPATAARRARGPAGCMKRVPWSAAWHAGAAQCPSVQHAGSVQRCAARPQLMRRTWRSSSAALSALRIGTGSGRQPPTPRKPPDAANCARRRGGGAPAAMGPWRAVGCRQLLLAAFKRCAVAAASRPPPDLHRPSPPKHEAGTAECPRSGRCTQRAALGGAARGQARSYAARAGGGELLVARGRL